MVKFSKPSSQEKLVCNCLSGRPLTKYEREQLKYMLNDPRLDDPEAAPVKEMLLTAGEIRGGGKGGSVLTLRMLSNILAVAIILGAGVGTYQVGVVNSTANWAINYLSRAGIIGPLCRGGLGGWLDVSYRLMKGAPSCANVLSKYRNIFDFIVLNISSGMALSSFKPLRNTILSLLLRLAPSGTNPDVPNELVIMNVNKNIVEAAEAADTKKTLEPSRPMTRTAPSLKRASSALPSISIVPPQKRIPLTKRRNSSRGGKKIRKTKKRC